MNPALQQDLARLVLRVALGAMILLHGIAKIRGGLGGITGMVEAQGLPGVLAYGVLVGEIVGPLLLLLGWHARIGALLVLVNMLFAVALAHMGQIGDLGPSGGWALELQGMFIAAAVAVALLGPGRFSVDRR
jgi:putative oxidoreductase